MHITQHPHSDARNTSGFTLTELAVVVVIISVLVGLSVSVGMTQIDVMKLRSTQGNMEAVRDALNLFQQKYKRYPCPALPADAFTSATYGSEKASCDTDCTGLTCSGNAIIGSIPFKTLKIAESLSYDGWSSKYTYVVDRNHVATSDYALGNLPLRDINGNDLTNSTVMGDAIFILISHGEDKKGGVTRSGSTPTSCGNTAIDSENCDGDAVFVDGPVRDGVTTSNVNYYNDWLVWQGQENIAPQIP